MLFEFKDIPVFYSDEGNGNVILLLHGFLESSTMWHELKPVLVQNNRVITVDLLGHGKTRCLGYIHTMELMAETVDAVLTHLNIDSFTVIGHSMGGYVALALAETTSKTINGLCLMNSTAQADSEERKTNRDRAISAVKQTHKAFVGMSIANLFSPDNRERLAQEIERVKEDALKTSVQGIIAALEGMKIRKDQTQLLRDASFKKLFIIGKKDPVLDYQSLLDEVRDTNVPMVEFPDGHMSYIENFTELSYNLLQFVEK
ncbi:MAG TPA: alpha/beta hydrolase [Aquaticitalea sp.]|nr:alpha/beta hydrolase [Aquaticitalea sp.]HNU58859.1 alpha/beta hydrolase [Aquaticitalea sp.]